MTRPLRYSEVAVHRGRECLIYDKCLLWVSLQYPEWKGFSCRECFRFREGKRCES